MSDTKNMNITEKPLTSVMENYIKPEKYSGIDVSQQGLKPPPVFPCRETAMCEGSDFNPGMRDLYSGLI